MIKAWSCFIQIINWAKHGQYQTNNLEPANHDAINTEIKHP